MSQSELVARAVAACEQLGIPYMLTGSVVSSLQGMPRQTHDTDMVIEMSSDLAEALAAQFPPPRYYLDVSAVRAAVGRRGMFNLLDTEDGGKVDFWLLTDEPFDRARFARRRRASLADISALISSPEDTILMKLRCSQLSGGSEKQFNDAKAVYELQSSALDLDYLRDWVAALGVGELWLRLEAEAEPLEP